MSALRITIRLKRWPIDWIYTWRGTVLMVGIVAVELWAIFVLPWR